MCENLNHEDAKSPPPRMARWSHRSVGPPAGFTLPNKSEAIMIAHVLPADAVRPVERSILTAYNLAFNLLSSGEGPT